MTCLDLRIQRLNSLTKAGYFRGGMFDINELEDAKSQQPSTGYPVYMNTGEHGLIGGSGRREEGTRNRSLQRMEGAAQVVGRGHRGQGIEG